MLHPDESGFPRVKEFKKNVKGAIKNINVFVLLQGLYFPERDHQGFFFHVLYNKQVHLKENSNYFP